MTAISSPLLESSIEGASGVVLNVTGGQDMTLHEVNEAAAVIYEVVDPNANIIFGAVIDDKLQGELRITVIATGFNGLPPRSRSEKTRTEGDSSKSVMSSGGLNTNTARDESLDIPEFLRRRRPLV